MSLTLKFQTNVLISEVAGVNLIIFLIVLPLLTMFLRTKYSVSPPKTDIAVARGSLLLLCVGSLLLGLAPNVGTMIPCMSVLSNCDR